MEEEGADEGREDPEQNAENQMTTVDYVNKVLGPEKDAQYWENLRNQIGVTVNQKYGVTNQLDQIPAIDDIRNFRSGPIIPPLGPYLTKQTSYFSTLADDRSVSYLSNLQNSTKPVLSATSLLPLQNQLPTREKSKFVDWLDRHVEKVVKGTREY